MVRMKLTTTTTATSRTTKRFLLYRRKLIQYVVAVVIIIMVVATSTVITIGTCTSPNKSFWFPLTTIVMVEAKQQYEQVVQRIQPSFITTTSIGRRRRPALVVPSSSISRQQQQQQPRYSENLLLLCFVHKSNFRINTKRCIQYCNPLFSFVNNINKNNRQQQLLQKRTIHNEYSTTTTKQIVLSSSIGNEEESNSETSIESIEQMGTFTELYHDYIPKWILHKCEELNYIYPTDIQRSSFDALYKYNVTDMVLQDETGSGKTLSYLIPALASIDPTRSTVQVLIVVPTRELGLQVSRVAKRLASGIVLQSKTNIDGSSQPTDDDYEEDNYDDYADDGDDNIDDNDISIDDNSVLEDASSSTSSTSTTTTTSTNKIMIMNVLQGSTNKRQRAWAWANPPHVVIGTPNELCKMIQRGGIKRYNSIKYVIVDEVDACLGGGSMNSIMSLATSSSAPTHPLHELLSKYLSPTYDDGNLIEELETSGTIITSNKNRPLSKIRKTIFCSATIPQVRHFLKQCVQNQWMLQEPQLIRPNMNWGRIGKRNSGSGSSGNVISSSLPQQIQHGYAVCLAKDYKLITLKRIIDKLYTSYSDDSNKTNPSNNNEIKVLIFTDPNRPMDEIATSIVKDVNKKYTNTNNPAAAVVWNERMASKLADNNELFGVKPTVIVSVLRYEDSLSQRAAAMNIFRGDNTNYYVPRTNTSSSSSFVRTNNQQHTIRNNNDALSSVRMRILLSNDLAARGIDIIDISHVIHYDLPNEIETYIHRSGRTGRLGRSGQVISIITTEEEFVLRRFANALYIPEDELKCLVRQQPQQQQQQQQQQQRKQS